MSQDTLSSILSKATKVLFVCGAGLSQESGIPCYRGFGAGERTAVITRSFYESNPSEVMEHFKRLKTLVARNRPGLAHYALKRLVDALESAGKQVMVCTQNIDGYERDAEIQNVVQLHGDLQSIDFESPDPFSNVVLTGDILDKGLLDRVTDFFADCDLLVMVGTSGEMLPWAILPRAITKSGSPFVYVNMDRTAIADYATVFIQGTASTGLDQMVTAVTASDNNSIAASVATG